MTGLSTLIFATISFATNSITIVLQLEYTNSNFLDVESYSHEIPTKIQTLGKLLNLRSNESRSGGARGLGLGF